MLTIYSFIGIPVIFTAKQCSSKARMLPSYTECLDEVFQPKHKLKNTYNRLSTKSKHHCAKFTVDYKMLFIKCRRGILALIALNLVHSTESGFSSHSFIADHF